MYRKLLNALLVLFILAITSNNIKAQQINIFNNNIINPFSLNPAMAGQNGSRIFLQQRNQWIGMQDAPVYSMLTAEWRLKDSRSAIGLSVSRNTSSILSNTSSYITYAPHFKISENQRLSFGLAVGIRNNSILFDRVNVMESGDPIIFDYNQAGTNIDATFGIAYNFKALEVQLVGLQLLNNKSSFSNYYEQKEFEYNFIRHYAGSISYKFSINKAFNITPIIQARNVQGFDIQPEAIVKLDYKDFLWAAAQYNYKRSAAFTVGVAVSEIFVIGYSAEFSTNQFANYSGGTHEIVFGIKFGKAFQTNLNKKNIEKMQKDTRGYDERIEYLKRQNERLRLEMKSQQKALEDLSKNASYTEIKNALDSQKTITKDTVQKSIIKTEQSIEKAPELKKDLPNQQKILNDSVKSKADKIMFYKGRSVLLYPSYKPLDEIAVLMKQNTKAKIEIRAYTDDKGKKDGNTELSKQRAESVMKYLTEKGISKDRFIIKEMGGTESDKNSSNTSGKKAAHKVEAELVF